MRTEVFRYQLDPTGTNPDNLVMNELHTLNIIPIRVITPVHGAFYSDTVVVYDHLLTNVLIKNLDYKFAGLLEEETIKYGKPVYHSILITNTLVSDKVRISYQCLGGEYCHYIKDAVDLIDNLSGDNRPASWNNIQNKPNIFTPNLHRHALPDIIGLNPVVNSLERVKNAITLKKIPVFQFILDWVRTTYGDNNYSIYPNIINVTRGTNITVNVVANDVPHGTQLYWTIKHGTTDDSDFPLVSGTFSILNGLGSFIIATEDIDNVINNETFSIELREDSITGLIVITSQTLVLNSSIVPTTIAQPTIISPVNNSINQNIDVAFTSSTFTVNDGTDTHEGSDWQIGLDANFNTIYQQIINNTTYKENWTHPNLDYNTTYYIRTRHKGTTTGYSYWSNAITFTTKASGTVNTPVLVNITPSNTSINPTINTSAFALSEGTDIHESTEWQLSTTDDFSNVIRQTISSTTGKTSWYIATALSYNTTYYIRFRYKGVVAGYSNWSSTTTITTQVAPTIVNPTLPYITKVWNNDSKPLVQLGTSDFAVSNGTDVHELTDWQVSYNNDFTNIAFQSMNNTVNKITWNPTTILDYSTIYYVRARHKGTNTGYSDWATNTFTTDSIYTWVQPTIELPVANGSIEPSYDITNSDLGIVIDVHSSLYDITGGNNIGNHISTTLQISLVSDFSSIHLTETKLSTDSNPNQFNDIFLSGYNKTYYIRVKHTDEFIGDSTWSATRTITIPNYNTIKPSITSPSNSDIVFNTVDIQGSAFAITGGYSEHTFSELYLSTNAGFIDAQIISKTTGDLTLFENIPLTTDLTYYIKIRYLSSYYPVSEWSDVITFTTDEDLNPNPVLNTPSISEPNYDNLIFSTVNVVSSLFSHAAGIATTHESSDWQIATDTLFTNIVEQSIDNTVDKTTHTFGNTYTFLLDTYYYIRVRYKAANGDYSSWSSIHRVKTRVSYIPYLEEAKKQASDYGSADHFGWSVSITDDGNRIVIGSYREDTGQTDAGAAYVFLRSGSIWTQEQKLQSTIPVEYGYFGYSVDISGDGTRLIVGAYGEDTITGAAYIFVRSGTVWSQEQRLEASNKATNDWFGYSVAIDGDGTRVIIGSYADDSPGQDAGSVYIFNRTVNVWAEEQQLVASDASTFVYFGNSVDIDSTGSRVIIGAYKKDTGQTDAGAAYIFLRSGTTWSEEQKLQADIPIFSSWFGNSVAITNSGDRVVIGSPVEDITGTNEGAAYIFSRSGTTWTQEERIEASDKTINDQFGFVVDINGDGTTVVIGSPYSDTNGVDAGKIYLFTRDLTNWTEEDILQSSDREAGDSFGYSVSISFNEPRVVVGAVYEDTGFSAAGSCYIFN